MPLHIDYRPTKLDQVVGNKSTIQVLTELLDRDRKDIPHTYLFHGPSGCGKTTLARIMSDELGCVNIDRKEFNTSNTGGIDMARSEIIENMRFKPMGGSVRVYIIDECFAKGTKIQSDKGEINIEDVCPGDFVYNLDGLATVKKVFIQSVPLKQVTKIKIDNKILFCSANHLFFTENGWIRAIDLKPKDVTFVFSGTMVYSRRQKNEKNMSNLREGIYSTNQQTSNMLQIMRPNIEEEKGRCWTRRKTLLRILREIFFNNNKKEKNNQILQSDLCREMENATDRSQEENIYRRMEEKGFGRTQKISQGKSNKIRRSKKSIFKKNDQKQSRTESQNNRKNETNKKNKWNIKYLAWGTRRKRKDHPSTRKAIPRFGLGNGVADFFRKTKKRIPNLLQSRFGKQTIKNGNRSRWQGTSYEKSAIKRQEENGYVRKARVENIEVYKRGNNDRSFQSIIGNKERNQGFIEFYDLEIRGHSSYFANSVLVHNCHQSSRHFQNAMLKPLEDAPSHVYFLLCTTDPDKLLRAIRSRCHSLPVSPLSDKEMLFLLRRTCRQAKIKGMGEVLNFIVDKVEGIPRDALILLDQVVGMETNKALEIISQAHVGGQVIGSLAQAINKRNWSAVRQIIENLSPDEIESVRRGILGYFTKVLLGGNGFGADVIDAFSRPFYDSGKAGLVLACWDLINEK